MDLKLQGRVVAITGGASGIGRSCALRYLEEGCRVAVCGRNRAKLEVFRRQCREAGHEVLCVEADVADTEALERFADTTVSHFGRLDVWYNNAGIGIYKPLMDVSLEEWDGLMGINLRGVFAGSRLAAERMQQGGVIVNASSFAARMPVAGNGAYAVSKWGVEALTRVLAAELAARGIRVFAYMPGMIETELTRGRIEGHREMMTSPIPLNRLGTPEDLAPVLVMLTSEIGRAHV